MRVKDRGPGIPQTELKRIFKRFYRIHGPIATRIKGTGLGLYIVRSVAKRHGGRTWAESPGAGHGSTFAHPLPLAKMSRILVVEDEKHLAEGLRFNLEAGSYQVEVVETAEAALYLLLGQSQTFDVVVLLDVMLPGKTDLKWSRRCARQGSSFLTLILTARGHSG